MREITYRQAINETLAEEMARDDRVILLGEDVTSYGGYLKCTHGLVEQFGSERVLDTPISESAMIGAAVGAAMIGLRPVVELSYIDFMGVCFDQILNQAAKLRYMTGGQVHVPLVIRTQGGGGRGGAAQHSQSLEAVVAHIPGLKVAMPSCAADAKGLLVTAIRDDNPVVFIEHKGLYAETGLVPEGEWQIPFGEGRFCREGRDVTVVAYSGMVRKAEEAARQLEQEGISVELIDLRTLEPLDWEQIIASVKRTHRLVVVHEACRKLGVGAEIAAFVQEELFGLLKAPVKRVAAPHTPMPYANSLEKLHVPSAHKIAEEIRSTLKGE